MNVTREEWTPAYFTHGPKRGETGTTRVSTVGAVALSMGSYSQLETGETVEMSPGIAGIAKCTCLSERSVMTALAILRETGWIERVRKGNSRAGLFDVYRLSLPPTMPAMVHCKCCIMQHGGDWPVR